MKTRAVLAAIGAVLLVASAAAHAFLGWPPFAADLREGGIEPDHITGLAIGWYFGSVAMVGFGLITAHAARELYCGRETGVPALGAIGLGYVAYGAVAFAATMHNPHFLGFIAIGLILLAAARPPRRGQG